MTIPRGFGNGNQEKRYVEHTKCGCTFAEKSIIGKQYGEGNGFHSYSCHDARKAMVLIGLFTVVIVGLMFTSVILSDIVDEANLPITRNIDGYNCGQLAEYVADKSKLYSYAEHRYEWLCVNEQIKEFS